MRRLHGWIALALLLLAAGAAAARGAAAEPRLEQLVILLRPPAVDELTREALSRITGELTAARFRVVIFPLDTGVDPIDQVETVGRDLDPVAAFALVREAGESPGTIELWISDRLAERTTIQRMRVQEAAPAGG